MLLDKTGTITQGEFSVTDFVAAHPAATPRLLALAAAVERLS